MIHNILEHPICLGTMGGAENEKMSELRSLPLVYYESREWRGMHGKNSIYRKRLQFCTHKLSHRLDSWDGKKAVNWQSAEIWASPIDLAKLNHTLLERSYVLSLYCQSTSLLSLLPSSHHLLLWLDFCTPLIGPFWSQWTHLDKPRLSSKSRSLA